jgi:hypothetical protein
MGVSLMNYESYDISEYQQLKCKTSSKSRQAYLSKVLQQSQCFELSWWSNHISLHSSPWTSHHGIISTTLYQRNIPKLMISLQFNRYQDQDQQIPTAAQRWKFYEIYHNNQHHLTRLPMGHLMAL